MATLVLSAVGTMLGGPAGGAIGSLIGQSFDQQMLGGGLREGPRLNDLAVQTSSYGTAIPRVYGTMRVAGSVVWATELKESSTLIGAKGQPQSEVYSYSVSFAVALSSRPVRAIKRIWADGQLLRGAAGDFKVRTGFRFYSGSEDQSLDPLIASLEGIGTTPAYRGIAMAVFENLELGEYGNRIPFLTFEVEADPGDVAVRELLEDASDRAIACSDPRTVKGYAAYGSSRRGALEPLIDCLGIKLSDDGQRLKSEADETPRIFTKTELGCVGEGGRGLRMERKVTPADNLPSSILLSYYDVGRDYQTGQQRASIGRAGPEAQIQAPAVFDAVQARSITETMLCGKWARRDRCTVRVPPSAMDILPGHRVGLPPDVGFWTVERVTVDTDGVQLGLHRGEADLAVADADAGRVASAPDIVASPTTIALFDLPALGSDVGPALLIGAASASAGWRAVGLRIDTAGEPIFASTAARQSVLGYALAALPAGEAALFDEVNFVDVKMVDPSDWLTSCDDQSLLKGANIAAIGDEIVQFGAAQALGQKKFRLSRLLRGRRGTEWAMSEHIPGEAFMVLQSGGARSLALPIAIRDTQVEVTPLGVADANAVTVTKLFTAEASRPPSPVHLRVSADEGGGLIATWVRRSRLGWDWLDETDAPLGESVEAYRVWLRGSAAELDIETQMTALVMSASQLAGLGSGTATISVAQVGDRAVSRPASTTFQIQ